MTLEKNVWCGTADFSHTANSGAEFDAYNNTPLFRYNAYFGIHTVYYLIWSRTAVSLHCR